MARINLLQSGMQGIDMKSNPLLIGAKQKLRFAANMIFNEGVLRSRYGFRYSSLCCSGQFQGAVDFQPARGLSHTPFGDTEGIALVVRGSFYFNGEKISGNVWKEKGPVNLFQAENYLIIQNSTSDTYWRDGDTLTKSPGMNEVDFAEIETPLTVVDIVPPVADIIDCAAGGGGGGGGGCSPESTEVIFRINDTITENPMVGAIFTLTLNENEVFVMTSNSGGVVTFDVPQDSYRYTISKTGYVTIQDAALEIDGCSENYARLAPLTCEMEILYARYAPGTPLTGTFLVANTGTGVAHITGVTLESLVTSIVPPLPITVPPGGFASVVIVSPTALAENTLTVETSCGEYEKEWEELEVESCSHIITASRSPEGISLYVTNTGGGDLTVESIDLTGSWLLNGFSDSGAGEVFLPTTILTGDFIHATWGGNGESNPPAEYTVVSTCGEDETTDTGTV